MAALADFSALINNLTGGAAVPPEHDWFWVDGRIQAAAALAPAAGRFYSLWQLNKSNGASGAFPTTGSTTIPGNTTIGAMQLTNPTGGRQKWLLGIENCLAVAANLIAYDRLATYGIGAPNAATFTPTAMAVTRYTGTESVGNQIWVEYTNVAQAVATHAFTVSYTNQAGTAGRTTKSTVTGALPGCGMVPVALQDGDTGVQSIQSITITVAGTATALMAVHIVRPLGMAISVGVAGGSIRDMIGGLPSMPEVKTGACVAFALFTNTTTVPTGFVGVHMLES